MKKLFPIIFLLSTNLCFAQTKRPGPDHFAIEKTIRGFLRWHKAAENDTSRRSYSITKGGYPDTTTQIRIDKDGSEKYIDVFRESGFVSEAYLDDIRDYYMDIDKGMAQMAIEKDLTKIPGMDVDVVLKLDEPEEVLDHIAESKITKLYIIANKALVEIHFSRYADLVVILTRTQDKKWLIDHLAYIPMPEGRYLKK